MTSKLIMGSNVRLQRPFSQGLSSSRSSKISYVFNPRSSRNENEDTTTDNSGFFEQSVEFVDKMVERQRKNLLKQQSVSVDLRRQIKEMEDRNAPAPVIRLMDWLADRNDSLNEFESTRLANLQLDREKYVEEWKAFEENAAAAMEPLDAEDTFSFVTTGEDSATEATGIVISAFLSAAVISYAASWFNINVGDLLPDPTLPTTAQLTTWAAYTAPYLGATAALAAVAAVGGSADRGTFRFPAEDAFFGKLHPTAIFSLAASLGYAQAVIYQGVWLLVFLKMYSGGGGGGGGNTDFLFDPAGADEAAVQQAMGSLFVSVPGLRALLAGPAAVLTAAVVETGYFGLKEVVNSVSQELVEGGGTSFLEDPEVNTAQIAEYLRTGKFSEISAPTATITPAEKEGEEADVAEAMMMTALRRPEIPSMAAWKMSTEEFWLVIGRVFVSSVYLGAETLITGNLGYAIATGAAGMTLGMFVRRSRARSAGQM